MFISPRAFFCCSLFLFACSSTNDGDDGTGGQVGGSAQGGGGGAGGKNTAASGGSGSSASGGSGGAANASGGTAGTVATGGMAGGPTGGNTAGAGGTPQGGAGGMGAMGAMGGTGGSSAAATPSVGCGKGGRPAGGEIIVADQYIFTFPPTYDGTTPMPVVFGFHGANNTNVSFRNTDAGTKGTDFEKLYVMAYVKSIGTNWTQNLNANFGRFDAVYTELSTKHCIDTSRVFAMGHSSGAQFSSSLVCRPDARLRAVAPVSAGTTNGNCRGIPALLIHGTRDTARGTSNGAEHVAQFVMRNGCATNSAVFNVPNCNSRQSGSVTPGCIEYQSCGANPTVWCSHNDPFYSNTNHGWPCFANQTILDFFKRFR